MSSPPVNSAEPSILSGSSCLVLQTTTYGGRSLFATSDILPGTRIHSCEAPFAFVIYKDYRKEVCAQCFAYSASDHTPSTVGSSRTWNIKWSRVGASTAWFCSDGCKDNWERDEASILFMEVDALLTKGRAATWKRPKSPEEGEIKSVLSVFESGDQPITQEVIDAAWESVAALATSKARLGQFYSMLHIEDMELEIARSLAAAIVRRHCNEQLSVASPIRSESWTQLLHLQANELCNVQTRPYMLTVYLRIYVFLSNALPDYLKRYMPTVRDMLARDTGNAFGIWDGDKRDEMMGWGIWVSASYFNHSCIPNVRKKRVRRMLHFETIRRVEMGEELCISYIDTDSSVDQRRRELEESWFFTCRCIRCEQETDSDVSRMD